MESPRADRAQSGAASAPGDPAVEASAIDPAASDSPTTHPSFAEDRVGDGDAGSWDGASEAASPAGRRRRIAAAGAVLLAALAIAAAVVLGSDSSPRRPSGTGVPPGETTAEVTRRTLTESSTVDGALGYGGSLELYDRLAEAGTFTWLAAVGEVIGRGGTLFRVNNLPVALMYGSVPAYRALKQGVGDGPDVVELNENLIDLGYDPYGAIADDERFSEATAAAVRRWQKAEGLAQTGAVQLGRVVFASGAQRVTKLHVALGQDPPGSRSEEPASKKEEKEKEPASKEPASKEPTSKEPGSKEPASKKPASSKKEPGSKGKKPASKEKESSSKGDSEEPASKEKEPASKKPASKEPGKEGGGGAGTLVLSTTSTQQIVTLEVKADQQSLAHMGEAAPVTLPNGDVVHGHITAVGTVATKPSEEEKSPGGEKGGGGESAKIPVTLVLDHRVAHLDAAPVSVELVKEVRHDVLAVPATALVATAGGGYAIEALAGDRRVELPVTPGMFANGYVQVEGAGVHQGLTVIESR
jgi:hypothetical protein